MFNPRETHYKIQEHDGFWRVCDKKTGLTVLCWIQDWKTAVGWKALFEEQRRLLGGQPPKADLKGTV